MSVRYVIIGNSFAGLFATEAIRKRDSSGEITIISDEPDTAYSRAMLHEWLAGMVGPDKVALRSSDFYDRLRVTPRLGESVAGVDVQDRSVTVTDSSPIAYDRLLVASGGEPFIPPGIGGIDDFDDVFTFTKMADAVAIREKASSSTDAVILGGGLIGLQCAEALSHLGLKVTVIELMDSILPMALDAESGAIVADEMRRQGISIFTGETIDELVGSGRTLESVRLKGGDQAPCQFLVAAVGVRPNTTFLKSSGLAIDRGVLVDDRMQTSVEDVYAAGDCAQAPEILTGLQMTIPVIPVASMHGTIAGCNMTGAERHFRGGLSLNAMQFGGIPLVSYGFVRDEKDGDVLKLRQDGVYKKVIIKGNRITGAVFVGAIDRAGLFRFLVEEKIDVSDFKDKLLSSEFGIAHLPKQERERLFTIPDQGLDKRQ